MNKQQGCFMLPGSSRHHQELKHDRISKKRGHPVKMPSFGFMYYRDQRIFRKRVLIFTPCSE